MNEIIADKEGNIESMIYEVRGKQVMLDSDLAKLYQCVNGTKDINKAVKRNLNRFPQDFYFELTKEEVFLIISRFRTGTLNKYDHLRGHNIKYLPHVFTEQGVAMLSSVLHTSVAEEISLQIMRAFVSMRHYIVEHKDVYQSLNRMNNKLIELDEKLNYLFSKFDQKEYLFLPGEVYDAYSSIVNIIEEAKKEILIIDAYADKTILDMIKRKSIPITLITSNKSKLSNIEIDKYNKQYHNLKVIYNNTFHDRYMILDKEEIYHIGSSLNHAGEKIFSMNKLEDAFMKEHLMDYIDQSINKS